tara:strand:- start:157 stop:663 length:507 start_codon:yes stop_codon:yes gene_type:complete
MCSQVRETEGTALTGLGQCLWSTGCCGSAIALKDWRAPQIARSAGKVPHLKPIVTGIKNRRTTTPDPTVVPDKQLLKWLSAVAWLAIEAGQMQEDSQLGCARRALRKDRTSQLRAAEQRDLAPLIAIQLNVEHMEPSDVFAGTQLDQFRKLSNIAALGNEVELQQRSN